MLVIRRARVHGPLLAAFVGTAMLLCGVAVAIVGRVDAAVDDGARAVASRHAGADLALRASLNLAADAERQDQQVRAALTRSLAAAATPLATDRTVAGEAMLVPHPGGGGEERAVTAMSVPDLPARADLVAGSWAEGDDDVMVQADAADELGVRPGKDVVLGGVRLHVAGTWRARDHLDPRWMGDPQVAVGSDDGQFGPVVVAETRWADVAAEPRARWVVVPDLRDVTAADLDAVATARDRLALDWTGRVDDAESLQVDGGLPAVAREVALRTDGLRSAEPVVLLLLAVVGLVTLAALARLFAATHAQELSLLWARGASSVSLARSAATEAAAAAAVGGCVGATLALVGASALGSQTSRPATTIAAAGLAVAAVAGAVAVLTGVQVRQSAESHAWRGPTGRAGRLIGPGLVALVVAGAALAVWQLRSYGSPVTVASDGVPAVDPVAVAAPPALLVAVVLLALMLFPVAAGLAEHRARGADTDVTRLLAARSLARRLVPVTAPVLVVAIATAALVSAASYGRTWADEFDTTRQLRAGADVRVSTGDTGTSGATLDAIADLPGVRAVAPVGVQLGGDFGSLVEVSPAALDMLGRGFSDDPERGRVAKALTSRTSAPELPPEATGVRVVLEADGLAAPPQVTLWVADPAGALRAVTVGTEADAGSGTLSYSAPLPADRSGLDGPRTIAALDLDIEPGARAVDDPARLGLVAITATGTSADQPLEDETWTAQLPGGEELALAPGEDAPSGDALVDPSNRRIRLSPSFAPGTPDGARVPVVLSQTAADRLDLGVGDPVELSIDGTYEQLQTTVAAVVPAVPGAPEESAALVDLRAVNQARLHDQEVVAPPTDLWVKTGDPEGVTAELRRLLPANSRIDTGTDAAGRSVLATGAVMWWWGAAGCSLLALLALDTVARGQLRSRRGDVAVLRALGLSVRSQQRLRGRELAWTVSFGLVAGLVAGVAVSLLTVPQLARAAVPEPYPTIATSLGVDVRGLLGGAALLVGGLALGVAAYAWRVGVEARRAGGPGAER
ncbi:ABC transporter permease [Nocardioides sp. T2.26MG-1]|uniref:ABC transporter permease n=1 Tax=Nocardioides sp. T2.26MG-1 TaxID=3041166 RepID=UPI00247760E4|nr:ABC transporter permease [Nocardioides sp. T2.26MG-1]CAI9399567.1 hypothetical protein HIDPHFAB_00222 [Nocardioides sp. T2.26MG-1]